jgi:hypothetical protein
MNSFWDVSTAAAKFLCASTTQCDGGGGLHLSASRVQFRKFAALCSFTTERRGCSTSMGRGQVEISMVNVLVSTLWIFFCSCSWWNCQRIGVVWMWDVSKQSQLKFIVMKKTPSDARRIFGGYDGRCPLKSGWIQSRNNDVVVWRIGWTRFPCLGVASLRLVLSS